MERKSPFFGTTSAVLAVLTVAILAIGIAVVANAGNQPPAAVETPADANRHGWDFLGQFMVALVGLVIAAAAAGLVSVGGVAAGVIALARGERARWRAVVGLVVCGGFVAMLLFVIVTAKSS
jgi:hypothetical protein